MAESAIAKAVKTTKLSRRRIRIEIQLWLRGKERHPFWPRPTATLPIDVSTHNSNLMICVRADCYRVEARAPEHLFQFHFQFQANVRSFVRSSIDRREHRVPENGKCILVARAAQREKNRLNYTAFASAQSGQFCTFKYCQNRNGKKGKKNRLHGRAI